jgi:predicted regulator of Ras-like GTPase activity (Roadblock/LC7/MglB family)
VGRARPGFGCVSTRIGDVSNASNLLQNRSLALVGAHAGRHGEGVVNAIATHPAELLDQLRDVSGVLGAFLVSSDGAVLAQALPDDRAPRAAAAARRLPLLLEALATGHKLRSYTLRFTEHRLYLQDVEGAFLAVLTELTCDAVLLKMTLNIAGKRLACLVHP